MAGGAAHSVVEVASSAVPLLQGTRLPGLSDFLLPTSEFPGIQIHSSLSQQKYFSAWANFTPKPCTWEKSKGPERSYSVSLSEFFPSPWGCQKEKALQKYQS